MFGRKRYSYYDQQPDFASYQFVEAVRTVVDSPRPTGPQTLMLAENGSIANPNDIPDSVVVIYFERGSVPPMILPIY